MNDAGLQQESEKHPFNDDNLSPDDSPQFGALDIVEAFTAMRHEWRGQTKESRALAEQVRATALSLQTLESKLQAQLVEGRDSGGDASDSNQVKPLVLALIETDFQLSRAVSAIAPWEATRRQSAEEDAKLAERYFAGMSHLARWFARPLLEFVTQQRAAQSLAAENPAIEGLNLLISRLRRVMNEHGIERVDTEGQMFDAEIMHAIGTVETSDHASGHVFEQLSPAYRWQGRLLRYADVRLAK